VYTPEIAELCMQKIFLPTIQAMNNEGRPFKGVLYFGLMLTESGPVLLEYNARFGDPETQVILPRLKTDLLEIFEAVIDEELEKVQLAWNDNACVCVVMASGGYPERYSKGHVIEGLDTISDAIVFHAGTKKENGCYYTNGGRVLGVTAMAETIEKARERAYHAVSCIHFQDAHFRRDIGIKSFDQP
jgi:phosphoribosylamine--glycine ligase